MALLLLLIGMVACRRAEESKSTSAKVADNPPTTGPSQHTTEKDHSLTPKVPPRRSQGSAGGSTFVDPEDARLHEDIEVCDREIKRLEAALAQRSELGQLIETAEKVKSEGQELPKDAQDFLHERNAMRSRIKDLEARRWALIKQAEQRRR